MQWLRKSKDVMRQMTTVTQPPLFCKKILLDDLCNNYGGTDTIVTNPSFERVNLNHVVVVVVDV